MGINLSSSFDMNSALPLDSRDVVTNLAARDAIALGRRYNGMKVYVVATGANYQLVGGTANANWVEVTGGGGGGGGGGSTDLSRYLKYQDDGSLIVTFLANVTSLFLEDELAAIWEVTASNSGELVITGPAVGTSVSEILLLQPNSAQVALKIQEGVVVSDTVVGIGELINELHLIAPSGMTWKVNVGDDGIIYLEQGSGNNLRVEDNQGNAFFKVKQDVDGAMFEAKPFTVPLPTPTPSDNNVPFAFHDGKLKIWDGTTWQSVQTTPVPADMFPLGTVLPSYLTLEEFLTEMNDPEGLRWKLSGDIPDSDLGTLKSWQFLPVTQGHFLRGDSQDNGNDPDFSSRFLHEGSLIGSYQADMYESHYHSIYTVRAHTTVDNSTVGRGAYSPAQYASSEYAGGNETRPKNIAVNFFVKYNR